jgi:hypothetical protein
MAVCSSHATGACRRRGKRKARRDLYLAGGLRVWDQRICAIHVFRRADRGGQPVRRDVGKDLVLGEAPLYVAVAVASCPELLDDPCREPERGDLWLGSVH